MFHFSSKDLSGLPALLARLRVPSAFSALIFSACLALRAHGQTVSLDETILLIRHAEKPLPALGQLSCKGLNRALALPDVLRRYGNPAAIYVPSPAARIKDGDDSDNAPTYSYLRPLATIEPYAIQLGMGVNAQIGYNELAKLQAEVLQPAYEHATVLLVWEHVQSVRFAKQLLAAFGEDPAVVPKWLGNDYETIYLFHLTTDKAGRKHLAFTTEREGLDGRLPETCPTVQLLPKK